MAVIYRGTPYQMELDRCYARYLTPDVCRLFQMYDLWKGNRPLFAPCYMDEPAVVIDAFRVISSYLSEASE